MSVTSRFFVLAFSLLVVSAANGATFMLSPGDLIQDAIDAAEDGDVILLEEGEYPEPINTEGKAIQIVGDSRDVVIGAFAAGTILVCNQGEGRDTVFARVRFLGGGDDSVVVLRGAGPTFIDCGIGASTVFGAPPVFQGGCVLIDGGAPRFESCGFSNGIAIAGGSVCALDADIEFDACRFSGGEATTGGGGFFLRSKIEMRACLFTSCSASGAGGGAFFGDGSELLCRDVRIEASDAYDGGGLAIANSVARLDQVRFESNEAALNGGGLYASDSVIHGSDLTWTTNSAAGRGGGAFGSDSEVLLYGFTMEGCVSEDDGAGVMSRRGTWVLHNGVFDNNESDGRGGGVRSERAAITVSNCTFSDNEAGSDGAHVSLFDCESSIVNSIVADRDASSGTIFADACVPLVRNCLIDDGWPGGTNIIDESPRFTTRLRLRDDSPCRDIGDASLLPPDVLDLDGDGDVDEAAPFDRELYRRVHDVPNGPPAIVDLGAHEWRAAPTSITPGSVLFVDHAASGVQTGSDWSEAIHELRDAIDIATANPGVVQEIRIAAGRHYPGPIDAGEDATFLLPEGVSLTGGFPPGGVGARDPDVWGTELNGDIDRSDSLDNPGSFTVDDILTIGRDQSFSVIDGLVFRRGEGVLVESPVAFRNCRFERCRDTLAVFDNASIELTNCRFRWNRDDMEIQSGVIEGCTFEHFQSVNPALEIRGSLTMRDCVFRYIEGDVLRLSSASADVTESLFEFNTQTLIFANGGQDSTTRTISNCTFRWNDVTASGAVVQMSNGQGLVSNCDILCNRGLGLLAYGAYGTVFDRCVFQGNLVRSSSGVLRIQDGAVVSACDFFENTVESAGTTIMAEGSDRDDPDSIISGCRFLGNVTGRGGAISHKGEFPLQVINCVIAGNSAQRGGAIYIEDAPGEIVNSTLYSNAASESGPAIHVEWFSGPPESVRVVNSIIWGHGEPASAIVQVGADALEIDFSNVEGGWSGAGGVGIAAVDPAFKDASGADGVAGTMDDDLTLQCASPLLDIGSEPRLPRDRLDLDEDGDVDEAWPLDLAGDVRIADGDYDGVARVDLGAYEVTGHANPSDLNIDGVVGFDDLNLLLDAWGLATPGLDLDGDGVVAFGDLDLLLDRWGETCEDVQ